MSVVYSSCSQPAGGIHGLEGALLPLLLPLLKSLSFLKAVQKRPFGGFELTRYTPPVFFATTDLDVPATYQYPPRPPLAAVQTPSIAVVEMMQCLSQAMSVSQRKPAGNKPADLAAAALLQLPHFDGDVLKKLKRRKVNTLKGAGVGHVVVKPGQRCQ